jgi:hypothetical protein
MCALRAVNPFPGPGPSWREIYLFSWIPLSLLVLGPILEALLVVALLRHRLGEGASAWRLFFWMVGVNLLTFSMTYFLLMLLPSHYPWLPAAIGVELLPLVVEFFALRYVLSLWQGWGYLTSPISARRTVLIVLAVNAVSLGVGLTVTWLLT